jgi:hypothetical protein
MAAITITKALTGYFNQGAGKRTSAVWLKELKALTPEEKTELATLVCEETGDTLSAGPAPSAK